jgi:hypothetical protein
MEELSLLKSVLIKSVEKNGNQPLTVQHLINIISIVEKQNEIAETREAIRIKQIYSECINPNQ